MSRDARRLLVAFFVMWAGGWAVIAWAASVAWAWEPLMLGPLALYLVMPPAFAWGVVGAIDEVVQEQGRELREIERRRLKKAP